MSRGSLSFQCVHKRVVDTNFLKQASIQMKTILDILVFVSNSNILNFGTLSRKLNKKVFLVSLIVSSLQFVLNFSVFRPFAPIFILSPTNSLRNNFYIPFRQ